MTAPTIDPLHLYTQPARLGTLGARVRQQAFADRVWVRPCPAHDPPAVAAMVRDGAPAELPAWPSPAALRPGDRLVLQVDDGEQARARYVAYLHELARHAPEGLAVAPCSPQPGGMHRLWCIAAARVLLPPTVRVEARHDLVGIRLAQLAVGFGADTLAGPVQPDRVLPLAGVTRPNEATAAGLATLVRQVGLHPHDDPPRIG